MGRKFWAKGENGSLSAILSIDGAMKTEKIGDPAEMDVPFGATKGGRDGEGWK